jgi:hypothetical protein
VDTKRLKDGPHIYWFKGVDLTGSVSDLAFLFFAVNTGPTLEILRPKPQEKVKGKVMVCGKYTAQIGLASFAFDAGKENVGTIEIVPGNPYWVHEFDFSKVKGSAVAIAFTLADLAGNKTTTKVSVTLLDELADLPVLTLRSPVAGKRYQGDVLLSGMVRDDDGVKALQYVLDGGKEPVVLPIKETFATLLSGLAPGKHRIAVHGIDANDKHGKDALVEFTITGPAPVVSVESVAGRKEGGQFRPGIEIGRDNGVVLTGRIVSPNKLQSMEYSWNNGASEKIATAKPGKPGETVFDIRVPAATPFGIVLLSVRALDEYGQAGEFKSLIHVTNYTRRNIEPGLYFSDPRIGTDGMVLLTPDAPLSGFLAEEEIGSVSLEPATDIVTVSSDGDRITVSAGASGISAPVRIKVVTKKNHTYFSPEFRFVTDNEKPTIALASPRVGDWLSREVSVNGGASDALGIKTLEYSLDGMRTFVPVEFPAAAKSSSFKLTSSLENVPDGLVSLAVRCVDLAGNTAVEQVTVLKDTTEPSVEILMPREDVEISGKFPLAGQVKDDGVITKVEWSIDGEIFSPATGTAVFSIIIDPANLPRPPEQITVRAADKSGNIGTVKIPIRLAQPAQPAEAAPASPAVKDTVKPSLELIYPPKDLKVHGKLLFIGKVSDNVGVKRLSYDAGAGNKGDIELFEGCPYWVQEVDFTNEKATRPTVSLVAEDLSGNKTEVRYTVALDPTSDQPIVSVAQPASKAQIEGDAFLLGTARDDEGVGKILYSLDGGSEKELPGAESFAVKLEGLAAGPHKVSVRAVDVNGTAGAKRETLFTIIGSAPEIRAASIMQGKESLPYYAGIRALIDKSTSLRGVVVVPNAVKSAEYAIQGGKTSQLPLQKTTTAGEFSFDIPLPVDLPYAKIDVRIAAMDSLGKKTELSTYFYRVGAETGGPGDAEGIYFVDSRIDGTGSILLAPGESVSGYFNGRPIKEVKVEPENLVIAASFEGNFLDVSASAEGLLEGVRIGIITVDGDSYQSDPLAFRCDAAAPTLTVATPSTGDWAAGKIEVKGTASDANGIRSVGYAIGDVGEFTPLELAKNDAGFSFDLPVELANIADGDVGFTVRAEDGAGRQSALSLRLMKDTVGPAIVMVTPPPEDPINGLILATGTAKDEGIVDSVEFSDDGTTFVPIAGTTVFLMHLDLAKYQALPEKFYFRATDRSGNSTVFSPTLNIQQAMDIPQAQIQIPQEGEVFRGDFSISGMAFDDDGIGAFTYRLDDGQWVKLPGAPSFSIPIQIKEIGDNEHTVEVQTEDIYGTRSEITKTMFKISTAEPTSKLVSPAISTTSRGIITLSGESSDNNGISEVFISFDNGQTFNRCESEEKWTYRLDTRILRDGTRPLLVKAIDGYGTEGIYMTIYNLDNAPPEIILDSPKDGAAVAEELLLDGRAWDNISLVSLTGRLRPLGAGSSGSPPYELPVKGIFSSVVDLKGFAPGWYDLTLEAMDQAENSSKVSRNVYIEERKSLDKLAILFPVNGQRLFGPFTLSGKVEAEERVSEVALTVDGKPAETIPVNSNGVFTLPVTSELLSDGTHIFETTAQLSGELEIRSEPRGIEYGKFGPWVRITSHTLRDFVTVRPYIKGEAGYALEPVDPTDKEAVARYMREREAHRVERVEVSLNNGRSFEPAQGREQWRYRLETQNFPDGDIRPIVKAVFADGSAAFDKTIVTIDDTPPEVTLLSPSEEGRFNKNIAMSGTAHDANGIAEVLATVRKGDKANYELPAFIQGLYLDGHAIGMTDWDVGAGLTFFQNNVKLQAQIGMLPADPDQRFTGLVVGAKLLANIAHFPFSFFLGPDWDFLSLSLAIGANFSYITNSGDTIAFTDKGLVLGGMVGQVEFPIVKISSWPVFNTYSLYTEYQLWFISSDISAGFVNRIAFGVRIGLF